MIHASINTRQYYAEQMINFLSNDGKRAIAMLQAYLDESGTHKGSSLVVVAGWVGDGKAWKSFIRRWNICLNDVGVKCFHAKNKSHERLKARMFRCIKKSNLEGVAWAVNQTDFKNNVSDRFMSRFGNEYSTCALLCAGKISQIAQKNKNDVALVVIAST